MVRAVLDNDILFKGSAYELLKAFIPLIPATEKEIGLLNAAHFIVPNLLKKAQLNKEHKAAILHFKETTKEAIVLEPTDEETKLAAELEFQAQQKFLPFDAGESQLLAILVSRSLDSLVTGDKRAISSMEEVCDNIIELKTIQGKILCLEQIFMRLIDQQGENVRKPVCNEPNIDKTLSICFCCHREASEVGEWLEGLTSYIESIRKKAKVLLSPQ